MGFLADLLIRIGGDATDLKREMSGARRDLQAWSRDLSGFGRTMTAAVTLPIVGVGVAALKTAGELEQNSIAFKTMLGSADAASNHLKELRDFALKTPFQFTELVVASKRLQALGFEAKSVIPTLQSVGDAAAALGMGAEGIQRIVTALGQMRAKGTVQAEEMRQLAEAGIPAWEILAKTLNTNVAGAMKLVQDRAVEAGTAVPAILAGINERFGGLMESQSKTFLGQLSNLKDSLTFTLQDLGTTLMPIAKSAMEGVLAPMLETVKGLAAGFANLPPAMQQTIIAMTALVAAIGPAAWAVGGITGGFSNLIGIAMRLPALLNPVTLGIAALGVAAGIAFLELNRATEKLSSLDAKFSEFITNMVTKETDFAAARQKLDAALASGALNANAYAQALAILEEREKKAFGEDARKMMADFGVTLEVTLPKAGGAAKKTMEELAKEANRQIDAWEAMDKRYTEQAENFIRNVKRMLDADETLGRSTLWVTAALRATHDAMQRKAEETVEIVVPFYNRIGEAMSRAMSGQTAQTVTGGAAERQIQIVGAGWSETLKKIQEGWKGAAKEASELERTARRAFDSMSRHLAKNLMEWKGWAGSIKQVGMDLATSFLEIMIRQLFRPLEDQFAKAAAKMSEWLNLGGGAASGAASTAGNTAGSTAANAGNTASKAPSSVPSGGGGGGGGAAGGAMGWVNMISGAVTAVSSVIGNFQMAGMNKSLDLIEKETRYSQLHLLAILDKINLHLPVLDNLRDAFYQHHMPAMAELISGGRSGSVTINIHESRDARATAQAVVAELKRLGINPAT